MLNNLSSDDLRRQLDENNAAMNTLAEDNQKIVELLARRGLQAVDPAGDDISIRPCIMQLDKLQIEPKPLTADELKAGGWWCDDTSKYCRLVFLNKDIAVNSQSWDGRYSFCFMHNDRVYRGLPRERSRVTCSKKQIHRIGGDFYWCAQ